MPVLYKQEMNKRWRAYCKDTPDLYGEGDDPVAALADLTEKVRAVLNTTLALIGCNELEATLIIRRQKE